MRAVWLEEFGGPEAVVFGEASDPAAGPGRALIEVAFASVTFADTMLRAGRFGLPAAERPVIPGNGVGGVVLSVGEGVDGAMIGRRVVASTGGSGGYAELAAADAGGLIPAPDDLDLDAATALLADGRTATMLVRASGLREGERVLVEAAAGGVGTLLVQLARNAGARVIAAAGGSRKAESARELGAAIAVDYREPGWEERVREAAGGVDVVFDGVGGAVGRSAFGLLGGGGRMVVHGTASGKWANITGEAAAERGVRLIGLLRPTPGEARAATEGALSEAAAGRLRPVIGQRFPLGEAARAHALIEARQTVGKTLLGVRG